MPPFVRNFLFLLALAFFLSNCSDQIPPRILLFSKTEGYRHESIPAARAALRKLCHANGIAVDTTEDAAEFNEKNLRRYNAIVFLCTTGDVLNPTQETDFERYIQAGGGYVGIHSATDTEYGWTWYGGLAGGYFSSHPEQQTATLQVENHHHPATKHLGETWQRYDEWYNFKNLNPNVQVLLSLDESSYKGGTNGANHPASWFHEYDGGRAFYTALGHTIESYTEPDFLKHILGGIRYAIGKKKRLNYTACRTPEIPDPTRFQKTVLAAELTEPMELDLLPDGKIIFIERRGAIKLFDPATGLVNIAHKLPVHDEFEDGLMGLALDPQYIDNHWIYLYYSPVGNESVNNLSRFVFRGDSLDRASEKIILQVAVQRQECCHSGGCIEFDAEGYLYLSTGDNTNPFASDGYSPSDERPGRSAWDAQKSSANTNDLRGKILRIKPLPDGGYLCPETNLFAGKNLVCHWPSEGEWPAWALGRPEIYTMGCRNPFRLSFDNRRKLLFWGEVGPDAGEPEKDRGPQGHDEINRAREAGFFGWPYFVGNNKPYHEYNFATRKSEPLYSSTQVINNSPNNTGKRELPPAQPAFIWYPYGNSPEFPLVGTGGRNAMAGPSYYCDEYPVETRFPDYYNEKLIIYDWMRGWMMAVTVDTFGNFSRMEPFAETIKLSRPMDMVIDKNGSLWVLEYGTQWFATNADARLSRIDYVRGNRPPIPEIQAKKTEGAAPFEACFALSNTKDYDGEKLQYELDFGDGTAVLKIAAKHPTARGGVSTLPESEQIRRARKHGNSPRALDTELDSIVHIYEKPGTYEARLKVTDNAGATKTAKMKISVGNEPPLVHWDFGGKNRSFYQPGQVLSYRLVVADTEDGSLDKGGITPASVATTIDYLETGFDITSIAQGHQAAKQVAEYARGKILMERSDCGTCHAEENAVNGPAYRSIAERYRKSELAVRDLAQKIIKGGAGNWGQVVMSAHPQITEESAGEMVRWILSLGDPPKPKQLIPLVGDYTLTPTLSKDKKAKPKAGTFIFKASYRDRGSQNQSPLEGWETIALRPAYQQAEQADSMSKNIQTYRPFNGDTVVLIELKTSSFFVFKHVDLTGVHSMVMGIGTSDSKYRFGGGRVEIRLGSAKGKLLGKAVLPQKEAGLKMEFAEATISISETVHPGFHDVYFVFKNENDPSKAVAAVDWVRFDLRE